MRPIVSSSSPVEECPQGGLAPDALSGKAVPSRSTPPTWTTAPEALAVCRHRPNRRRAALIAAVVGIALVGINQGSVLASGHLDWVVWVRMALDYLIPACVSTMEVLAGPGGWIPRLTVTCRSAA
jgi:hypothetical protein